MNLKLKARLRRKLQRSGLDWALTDYLTHPENWIPVK